MPVEELQTLEGLTHQDRVNLLQLMGYSSDGRRVLTADGSVYRDPFTNEEVLVERMAVLPGSWVVIDYNPVSIAGYRFRYEE